MKNSVVERKGTVLNRSVVRQNTATIIQSNPSLTFAVVTLPTSESLTPLDSNLTAPSKHLPARKLAGVSPRPLAVPVMSSPRPSFSTQTCLRSAFGVNPRRMLADGVASGGSHCMTHAFPTSPTPALHDGCQSPSCPASTPPSAQSAACRKRQRSLATLEVLAA